MFLHLLNGAQKQCFCNVAQFIVSADGVVDDRERRLLAKAQLELDLDELPPRVTSLALLAHQLNVFDSPVSRNILLLEAVTLAMADGAIPASEREVLESLCEVMQVPRARVNDFERYAKKLTELVVEGEQLVFS